MTRVRFEESLRAAIPLIALVLLFPEVQASEKWLSREESELRIYVAGRQIGTEKYAIMISGDSASSTSVSNFRDPSKHQKVRIETRLNMNGHFLPQNYELKRNVDGQKAGITGVFPPNYASFQYTGNGTVAKRGLLVGDEYTVLDTNVFHHFVFLVRLFKSGLSNESQQFEVVVPQELDNGILKMNEIGLETIMVDGKMKQLYHLQADSGVLLIDLWADGQPILYKIAIPAKGIEVIRNP